jgi:hypothetical protein
VKHGKIKVKMLTFKEETARCEDSEDVPALKLTVSPQG